jgi:ABC-type glutathione transport system ATPase component
MLDGENLTTLPRHQVRKRRLDFQMIFQDPYASLNPRMTVYSTLAEAVKQRHPNLKGEALDQHIADNIAVMHQGEIVEYGEAEELFNQPQHSYTQTLLEAIPHIQQSA